MSGGRRAWMRWMWRGHRFWWRVSGGRLGARIRGLPVLELTTTGRRSGARRSVLLSYVPHDDGFAVIASNAGAATDPAWWSNLQAQPDAEVRARRGRVAVVAEILEGPARDRAWEAAVRANPDYARYAATAGRPIPVVLLRRTVTST